MNFTLLSHLCTKCKMKYCEGTEMSLAVRLLARLLGRVRASLKKWRISFRLCFVLSVSKFYFAGIEFKVWLWNAIRIAEYFPAILLLET